MSCSATFTMTNGVGASISGVPRIRAPGDITETNCLGIGTPVGSVSFPPGSKTLQFGGRVTGDTAVSFVDAAYTTANPGGSDIQVEVVYQ